MGAKRNLRELRAALKNEEPVRLARSLRGAEALDGFVVALGDEWVLLHRLFDVRLDGWSAVRLDTVESVRRGGPQALASRVLRVRSQRPVALNVNLGSATSVIKTMADALPLVTLSREALYPNELADVTRVDTGADYETALHQLAGDPPPIPRGTPSIRAS
jgi:hypothetical protein